MYSGLIESLIVIVVSMVGVADAWRLSGIVREGGVFHDVIGPDRYLGAVSIGVLICGVWQLRGSLKNLGKQVCVKEEEEKTNVSMLSLVIVVLVVYVLSLPLLGYLLATLFFFPVTYFIFGVRSMIKSITLGVLTALIFYGIFAYFAELPLPKGLLESIL